VLELVSPARRDKGDVGVVDWIIGVGLLEKSFEEDVVARNRVEEKPFEIGI
jgi:hypothetical protein